jgi:hypothetical protein
MLRTQQDHVVIPKPFLAKTMASVRVWEKARQGVAEETKLLCPPGG